MTVRTITRRGRRKFVIDLWHHKKDGTLARFRHDSAAVTITAAREEERRVRDRIARTGSPYEEPVSHEPVLTPTYREVVERFRSTYMQTELKFTSRRGYEHVLTHHLVPIFGDLPITEVNSRMVRQLDFELGKQRVRRKKLRAKSTRNNILIVLRSTLQFAVQEGDLPAMPAGLPPLKQPERTVLEIPADEDVLKILAAASDSQRRAFLLMAYAGLRPNEVRALIWRDVRLGTKGGFLTVRRGKSYGELHTPKTGQREIPLAPPLWKELSRTKHASPDGHVALTRSEKPWGQCGIGQAFERVLAAAGLSGWSVYVLRHYAITLWLRAGVPVHVVQRMAGHTNLSTTQRYVHFLKADLEKAAEAIGNILVTDYGAGSEPELPTL